MNTWKRVTPFDAHGQSEYREDWVYYDDGQPVESFEVSVKIGKPLDVMQLRNTSLTEISRYAEFLKKTAKAIYAPPNAPAEIRQCPCCEYTVQPNDRDFAIFDVAYRVCSHCGHTFVGAQPPTDFYREHFKQSGEHAATYADKETLELRMAQVIQPKLEWVRQIFQTQHRDPIAALLDVGAGGGHFVEACRRSGIAASGYELSSASVGFARQTFGVRLMQADFLAAPVTGNFDVLTFWGLLEYTPEPTAFIKKAAELLSGVQGGLLVLEVPRADCLGSTVQKEEGAVIARHLDPTSHVNCFSDQSILTALYRHRFKPVAAWYFGMDVYEVLTQCALKAGEDGFLEKAADLIPGLQQCIDAGKLCDDVILAAVPF